MNSLFYKNICEKDLNRKITQMIEDMVMSCENGGKENDIFISARLCHGSEQEPGFDELYEKS